MPKAVADSDFQEDTSFTAASITFFGWTELGLGANGKRSEALLAGGVNTERGSFGCGFGPLRRPLRPGDGKG